MAIYHASMKILGRQVKRGGKVVPGKCNSVVAAAAYQGGHTLHDERNEQMQDYRRKGGVAFTTILTPEGAPEWMRDPERLWNAVEFREDESNRHASAQLARHLEFALPVELTSEENRALALDIGSEFSARGMVAQVSIHEPENEYGQRNPHAHLLLTMREARADGFGKKNREWNGGWMAEGTPDGGALKDWRAMIADHTNEALTRAGHESQVDARSYKDQGIDRLPTVHQGKEATALQRQGARTRQGDRRKAVGALNATRASDGVQRVEDEENGKARATREAYDQQGQKTTRPSPPSPQPEWAGRNGQSGPARTQVPERERE